MQVVYHLQSAGNCSGGLQALKPHFSMKKSLPIMKKHSSDGYVK